LIAAAVVEFSAEGFHGATTRAICARADLSPAGMYVHFPSKTDLLFEACRIGHEGALHAVKRALAAADPNPLEHVRAYVRAFTFYNAEFHALSRVVQYEFASLPASELRRITAIRGDFERLMTDELDAGVAMGVFDIPDVRGTAIALLSLGIDVARWYSPAHGGGPDRVADLYVELATRMILPRSG
jgi:AcrR family transcriptional regulator